LALGLEKKYIIEV